MLKAVFNLIGFCSAVSLLLIGIYVIPGVIRGEGRSVRDFFEVYRGSEPFVIVMAPIILIVGPAWIWRQCTNLKHRWASMGRK